MRLAIMNTTMQLNGFFGSTSAFAQRSTPVRPRTRFAARAEKAASAGTWLPGVDSPSWLEEADLPANRGERTHAYKSFAALKKYSIRNHLEIQPIRD